MSAILFKGMSVIMDKFSQFRDIFFSQFRHSRIGLNCLGRLTDLGAVKHCI